MNAQADHVAFWAAPYFTSDDEIEHALQSTANASPLKRALAIVIKAPSEAFGGAEAHYQVMEALHLALRMHETVLKDIQSRGGVANA